MQLLFFKSLKLTFEFNMVLKKSLKKTLIYTFPFYKIFKPFDRSTYILLPQRKSSLKTQEGLTCLMAIVHYNPKRTLIFPVILSDSEPAPQIQLNISALSNSIDQKHNGFIGMVLLRPLTKPLLGPGLTLFHSLPELSPDPVCCVM